MGLFFRTFLMFWTLLYETVLYGTVLYGIVLFGTVLYRIVLFGTVLYMHQFESCRSDSFSSS